MAKSKPQKRKNAESPCIDLCVIDSNERLCKGCYRTIDEITDWGKLDSETRHAIMQTLPARASRLKPTGKRQR